MKIFIAFIVVALTSCGVSHKLRKAERLIKEAIAMGAEVKADTVYSTKIIEGPKTTVAVPVDRLVFSLRDTVIFQDRIKIHTQVRTDTFKIQVECPSDTIRVPVTVTRTIVCPPCAKDKFWKGFGFGAGAVLLLLIVLGVVRALR